MYRYRVISNLFNKQGLLDLKGDEEEVNVSQTDYTREEADDRITYLGTQYPNAYIDWTVVATEEAQHNANVVDGYDRDDLGESPDY